MKRKTLIILFVATAILSNNIFAQFTLSSEFRFNPVYSRGFRSQFTSNDKPGAYMHQRSRLISSYKKEKDIEVNITLQDWRIWGDQNERKDIAEITLFRAYVKKWITPQLSFKAGRLGLSYDDKHLFGGRNWGGKMAHDAAILMYEDSTFKSHLILAYNANGWDYNRDIYEYNFYKTLQTIWLHKDWSKLKASFYIINRGLEKASDTSVVFNQTIGPHLTYKLSDALTIKAMYFHQLGKDTSLNAINANYISVQAMLKVSDKLGLTLGMDRGSGTDAGKLNDVNNKDNNTFDRMYGLIHGHFGYLDYFYRKFNPPGTTDGYLKLKITPNKKWTIDNHIHGFFNSADVFDPMDATKVVDPFLGVENDLKITCKVSSDTKVTFGHSIFFATDSMDKTVFGGGTSKDNQFTYFVITMNPTFFKSESK